MRQYQKRSEDGLDETGPRIAFVLGFLPDPRMEVRMETLADMGKIEALCWDRGTAMVPSTSLTCGWQLRAFIHPASGLSLQRLRAFFGFARDAWQGLMALSPSVIHFQGLDTAFLVFSYKGLCKVLPARPAPIVVMEIADVHPLLFSDSRSRLRRSVARVLSAVEGSFARACDLLVLTSRRHWEARYRAYSKLEKTLFVPNTAGALQLSEMEPRPLADPLRIGYFGVIRHKDSVLCLIDAARSSKAEVVIAGVETDGDEVRRYCESQEHVTWLGAFRREDLANLYSQVDLVYSLYDVHRENVRQSLTNKLFEGVFSARPVIVPAGTYMAEVVNEKSIGFVVPSDNDGALENLLRTLVASPEIIAERQRGCLAYREELIGEEAMADYRRRIEQLLAETLK